jgi:hypothetical protein
VKDKVSKMPFPSSESVAMKLYDTGRSKIELVLLPANAKQGLTAPHNIHIYPGAGSHDGNSGDHIILAPAFNITHSDVDLIVERVGNLVETFFEEYDRSHAQAS